MLARARAAMGMVEPEVVGGSNGTPTTRPGRFGQRAGRRAQASVHDHADFSVTRQHFKISRVCRVPGAVNVACWGTVVAKPAERISRFRRWPAYLRRSSIVLMGSGGGPAAAGTGMAFSPMSRRVRVTAWLTLVGWMPKRTAAALAVRQRWSRRRRMRTWPVTSVRRFPWGPARRMALTRRRPRLRWYFCSRSASNGTSSAAASAFTSPGWRPVRAGWFRVPAWPGPEVPALRGRPRGCGMREQGVVPLAVPFAAY